MAAALLLAVGACAGTGGIEPGRTDAAFREIQQHEARIERARDRIERGAAGDDAQHAAREATGAADAICERAHELADADALTRCDRAREQARAVQQRADAGSEGAARESDGP
jgi:hypothetical protein